MNLLKFLLSALLLLGCFENISSNNLWDIILFDVSSDMDAYAQNNVKEMKLAEDCLLFLAEEESPDSIMVFAEGRAILPAKDVYDKRYSYDHIRKILGDGTAIKDALASCLGRKNTKSRILLITNGRESGSSISSHTLTKLMRSKGICVDAAIISAGCDSVYLKSIIEPSDSVLYDRTHISSGLKNIVDNSGGRIVTVDGESDIKTKIKELVSLIAKKNNQPSKVNSNLNSVLTNGMLGRIKTQKINICEVDTNSVIRYNGKVYHGLNDILKLSESDLSILPDYEADMRHEGNKALNLVFVTEQHEYERKKSILNQIKTGNTYCKLRQDTPLDILPMIYYSGIGDKMLVCGLEYE